MPQFVKGSRASYSYADITLQDFADAKKLNATGRIRKRNNKAINNENLLSANPDADDYLDDGMANIYKIDDSKTETTKTEMNAEHTYNVYPNDIWYLIAEHIRPEDVCRFALISKQTYAITTSMKFWKNLYKRYYDPNVPLPVRLQPNCMTRPGGMRACAIRSLFYTYPVFVNRLTKQSQQDFHLLAKRYVERFWFTQVSRTKWQYFYKLKQKAMPGSRVAESEQLYRRDRKSLKSMSDVYLNTEEGRALLVIESTKFHPLPRFSEEMEYDSKFILGSVAHLLARSCDHYRLEMKFTNTSRQVVASIVYEPTTSVRVYDWWTPTYAKYVKPGIQPNLEYICDEKEVVDDALEDDDAWDYVINNFS